MAMAAVTPYRSVMKAAVAVPPGRSHLPPPGSAALAQPQCLGEVPHGFGPAAPGGGYAAEFAQRRCELVVAAEVKPDPCGTAQRTGRLSDPAELAQRKSGSGEHPGFGLRVTAGAGGPHAEAYGSQLVCVAAVPGKQRPQHPGKAGGGGVVTTDDGCTQRGDQAGWCRSVQAGLA